MLEVPDNARLRELCGGVDENIAALEQRLDVTIARRGNRIVVQGAPDQRKAAGQVLAALARRTESGLAVGLLDVETAVRMVSDEDGEGLACVAGEGPQFRTATGVVRPRTPAQRDFMHALAESDLVFGVGPAGTGKTYLAVAAAVSGFLEGRVERIVLSRPAVEAGERLGFLPGDLREKIDPYLLPLYDALDSMLTRRRVEEHIAQGRIEIAPLAFMRGRTLSNVFVVLDEAQNCSVMQMKMFLTRLGSGSRMAITGDLTQIDLPRGTASGLPHAQRILKDTPGVTFAEFSARDAVRHPLVNRIIDAYASDRTRP